LCGDEVLLTATARNLGRLNTDLSRNVPARPKSAMIGLTRGSKQSHYSDVIGVLCFGCDKMTSQSSALFMTCSIQNSFSGKL
jgi:hypothetical protein